MTSLKWVCVVHGMRMREMRMSESSQFGRSRKMTLWMVAFELQLEDEMSGD